MQLNDRFYAGIATIVVVVLLEFCLATNSFAANQAQRWQVQSAKHPEITITDKVIHQNDPNLLFGFNLNYRQFQTQLWHKSQKLKPGIAEALRPFKGAIFRYPGGSVANAYHWQEAIGPLDSREPQKSFYDKKLTPVQFGIDEYLDFVASVDGMPWYVLNLVGLDLASPFSVADKEAVAESNLGLANYLIERLSSHKKPLYLQLGNELDRSRYEWTGEQYAGRAKAVVDLINSKVAPDNIEFVSFLRDFKWRFKRNKSLADSQPDDYMRTVDKVLGSTVTDYSLHHYYDGNRLDGNSRTIPFWLKLLSRSIDDYQKLKNQPASIWITEHGRQPMSRKPGKDNSTQSTSNMAAAISTADYLIALSQFPEVKGAVWHALNAGPWQLFDYSVKHKDLRPRPIYWGLRVLRKMELEFCLETFTSSPNISKYAGGYDIRAVAFRDQAHNQLGLRIVNRAPQSQTVKLNYARFAGQNIRFKLYSVSLPENLDVELDDDKILVNLEPNEVSAKFDSAGGLSIDIPASSVSVVSIDRDLSKTQQ